MDTTITTREFACGVLAPDGAIPVVIAVHVDERTEVSFLDAVETTQSAIADVAARSPDTIEIRIEPLENPPQEWDSIDWDVALQDHNPREGLRGLRLTIFWVQDMDGATTGEALAPGVVAISEAGLEAKAAATGRPVQAVAVAALLHHVGHALGAVNRGIPMQANHEGVPGHDSNETSVMHHSWHDAGDATWAHNATYDGYTNATRHDWTLALANPMVCP